MKRLIIGMTAAMALALTGTARADDTKTTESKSTVKHNDDGTGSVKTEKKAKTNPKGGMNSTTDSSTYTKDVDKNSMGGTTTKVEKKAKHDAPGTAGRLQARLEGDDREGRLRQRGEAREERPRREDRRGEVGRSRHCR